MSAVAAQRAFIYKPAIRHGRALKVRPAAAVIRSAVAQDAAGIHNLIVEHAAEGRLLPRSLPEIGARIDRFVVATVAGRIVGCADLAQLSPTTAEVRSLVVATVARSGGLGRRLLGELVARASATGFRELAVFTHSPAYFVRAGFSLVPHAWVPEKIERDCRSCASFRRCGQSALVLTLVGTSDRSVSRGLLHG